MEESVFPSLNKIVYCAVSTFVCIFTNFRYTSCEILLYGHIYSTFHFSPFPPHWNHQAPNLLQCFQFLLVSYSYFFQPSLHTQSFVLYSQWLSSLAFWCSLHCQFPAILDQIKFKSLVHFMALVPDFSKKNKKITEIL